MAAPRVGQNLERVARSDRVRLDPCGASPELLGGLPVEAGPSAVGYPKGSGPAAAPQPLPPYVEGGGAAPPALPIYPRIGYNGDMRIYPLDRYQFNLRARLRRFFRHSGMEEVSIPELSRLLVEFDGSAFVADQAVIGQALRGIGWYPERDPKSWGQARTWVKPWRRPRRRRPQAEPEVHGHTVELYPIDPRADWDRWYAGLG